MTTNNIEITYNHMIHFTPKIKSGVAMFQVMIECAMLAKMARIAGAEIQNNEYSDFHRKDYTTDIIDEDGNIFTMIATYYNEGFEPMKLSLAYKGIDGVSKDSTFDIDRTFTDEMEKLNHEAFKSFK